MVFVGRPLLSGVLTAERTGDSLSKERWRSCWRCCCRRRWITEVIGIHALFGAFVCGAVMPDGEPFRAGACRRLESVSSVFLLPLFFAYTGLRTQIGLLDDVASWAHVPGDHRRRRRRASSARHGRCAARWTGLSWRDSVALGALMNTRGLMELIALNVGFDLGVISPAIFTMMVLMALVTTAMTGPLVSLSFNWGKDRALAPAGPVARSS